MAQKPARNWAHPRALMRDEIPSGVAQKVYKNGDIEVLTITGGHNGRYDASVTVYHKSHVADDVFTEGKSYYEIISGETVSQAHESWSK